MRLPQPFAHVSAYAQVKQHLVAFGCALSILEKLRSAVLLPRGLLVRQGAPAFVAGRNSWCPFYKRLGGLKTLGR